MARSIFSLASFPSSSSRRNLESLKGLFLVPACFVLVIYFFVFFYVSSTLKLVIHRDQVLPHHTYLQITPKLSSSYNHIAALNSSIAKIVEKTKPRRRLDLNDFHANLSSSSEPPAAEQIVVEDDDDIAKVANLTIDSVNIYDGQSSTDVQDFNKGDKLNQVFHDEEIFQENYKQMNKTFKIYVYPHKQNDPFANVLLPVSYEPGGNYASESYFKKALMGSHFITNNPSEADFFFLPFSIAGLRHDKRVGVGGIQKFVRDYIHNISHMYPYWNRTGGADHFYVACHSIGKLAMEKAVEVRGNAIQLVCSSNYFLKGYVAHKDASVPQIWPRHGDLPNQPLSKRKKLAFYAGAMNSKVRESLVGIWKNDPEISVHQNRLKTPYHESLLGSKFCIHAKGFEVNTARIGDALYYGCVPVVLADHYDLPFADILNWESFSVVVLTMDIPNLKKILKEIEFEGYENLQKNVLKVRNHFQWHTSAVDYDAFYMVMYELWLRRTCARFSL